MRQQAAESPKQAPACRPYLQTNQLRWLLDRLLRPLLYKATQSRVIFPITHMPWCGPASALRLEPAAAAAVLAAALSLHLQIEQHDGRHSSFLMPQC